jgi:thiamine pyrophosphate-dependent acetolactate synthase large subunit-like protein
MTTALPASSPRFWRGSGMGASHSWPARRGRSCPGILAAEISALKVSDAGDVQANGFEVNADETPFETVPESGASFMGLAGSSLLSTAAADKPRHVIAFSGDGSFIMNPQVLLDAAVPRGHAMIVVFGNRRMAAISSLQMAQYHRDAGRTTTFLWSSSPWPMPSGA